ncbi:MAG: type II secretion system protein [Candidatus Paceibacterota bacterium]
MKIKTRNKRAFVFVELLVILAIIGIMAAMLLPAIVKAKKRAAENQLKEEVAKTSIIELPAGITGKVFKVHCVYTNNLAKVMLVGETAGGPKSMSFITSVPPKSPIPMAGKFYTATDSGLAEVVGSATDPSPTGQH